MKLASMYIGFWIAPALFAYIEEKSANARVRKATVKDYFGWSIAFN